MKIPDKWWSYPAESESGRTVIVTGRDGVQPLIEKGKYKYRVDVAWRYGGRPDGMPADADAELMDQATEAIRKGFDSDPVAVLTGIYTGDGERTWVFYTMSLPIFGKVFNRSLADVPEMPLEMEAVEDPAWEEYREMREMTYVPDEE